MKKLVFLGYIIFMAVAPFVMWYAMFRYHNHDLGSFTKVQFIFLSGITFLGIMAAYAAYLGYKDYVKDTKNMIIRSNADEDRPE